MKKNLTYYKKKAWVACSKYVRSYWAKDGMCTCYTCGKVKPIKQMQAGHGMSGRSNSILFELDLLRPQCYSCNICNSGKLDEFIMKLRKELGDDRVDELYKQKHTIKKFTIQELKDIKDMFELETVALMKGEYHV